MGDDRGWSPETNGVEEEEEYWRLAEAVTQEIIEKVQATQVSEERRRAVVDYVQRLIRSSTCCQVFPFGSVPLKTYLPDGDIDLTAVSCLNVGEEALANEVFSVLEREDQNLEAEFVVRDVQLIRAEVKLVKCLVQNIIVDISFNQLGGLSTLCFLEKVALLIGKDHLFKRSIILIKAWCYYESRILGAHHGLISTYALETLVLYIFNLFHSSLNGPFAVLYKFLKYFSKFDWDTYCITMNGPVRISSLPEFVVERHEIGRCDMLVGDDFFKECVQTFSVSAREFEADSRVFPPKHLNIVDPLRENNNLGRSVSKGNFFRIKSAFTYGARKLGLIMSLPEENVASELQNFFSNTLERHGIGQRPDLQDHVPIDEPYGFGTSFSFSSKESNFEDHILATSESVDFSGVIEGCADYTSRKTGNGMSSSEMENEEPNSVNWTAFSGNRLIGDAVDLASSRNQGLLISKDVLKSCMSSFGPSITPVKKAYHAPHADNGKMENGNSEWNQVEGSGLPAVLLVPGEEMTRVVCTDLDGRFHTDQQFLSPDTAKNDHFNSVAHFSADFSRGYCCDQAVASIAGSPKAFNYLADLSGDYDCHMNNLNNSRCLYEYALKSPVSSMPSAFVSHLQNKGSGDFTRQSARRNAISLVDGPRTAMLYLNPSLIPAAAFGMDEMPKPRGTGTYFPNTNHDRDRVSTTRVRQQASVWSPHSNGLMNTPHETSLPERNSHEKSQPHVLNHRNGGKSGCPDLRQPSSGSKLYSHVNGTSHLPERVLEFGRLGHLQSEPITVETGRQLNQGSVLAQNTNISTPTRGTHKTKAISLKEQERYGFIQNTNISTPTRGTHKTKAISLEEQERIDAQSYKLKDDDDFPPLTDLNGKGSAPYNVKSNKS